MRGCAGGGPGAETGWQDVAHILNDETQRKFIQSVKRLMTYSQNKYPPSSFTKAIEPTCIDQHAPSYLRQVRRHACPALRRDGADG